MPNITNDKTEIKQEEIIDTKDNKEELQKEEEVKKEGEVKKEEEKPQENKLPTLDDMLKY